jgi:hypothetical protein
MLFGSFPAFTPTDCQNAFAARNLPELFFWIFVYKEKTGCFPEYMSEFAYFPVSGKLYTGRT